MHRDASSDAPLLTFGSSGVGYALAAYWKKAGLIPGPQPFPDPGDAGPMVVVSGSCSPVTARQIDHAREAGFAELPLDTPALVTRMLAALNRSIETLIKFHRTHAKKAIIDAGPVFYGCAGACAMTAEPPRIGPHLGLPPMRA